MFVPEGNLRAIAIRKMKIKAKGYFHFNISNSRGIEKLLACVLFHLGEILGIKPRQAVVFKSISYVFRRQSLNGSKRQPTDHIVEKEMKANQVCQGEFEESLRAYPRNC